MIEILPVIVILVLVFGLCYVGGKMAESNGQSFAMGFLLVLFLNIAGLLIIAFIGSSAEKRTFDPKFKDHTNDKVATIKQLGKMHEEGKLTDEEFERLKSEILNTDD